MDTDFYNYLSLFGSEKTQSQILGHPAPTLQDGMLCISGHFTAIFYSTSFSLYPDLFSCLIFELHMLIWLRYFTELSGVLINKLSMIKNYKKYSSQTTLTQYLSLISGLSSHKVISLAFLVSVSYGNILSTTM